MTEPEIQTLEIFVINYVISAGIIDGVMNKILAIKLLENEHKGTLENRVGGNFFPLSHHRACRSAPGGSIQIVFNTTNESSLCEDFF